MKTLAELSFKSNPIHNMVKDSKSLHERTQDQYIEAYELDNSRIKPFYLVDENRWQINLPSIDEDDLKNFAAGARKIFSNGRLTHYDYMYRLDHKFFCSWTLMEEARFKENGECVVYEV